MVFITQKELREKMPLSLRAKNERKWELRVLNVERGEGKGNWFQGCGAEPHMEATT